MIRRWKDIPAADLAKSLEAAGISAETEVVNGSIHSLTLAFGDNPPIRLGAAWEHLKVALPEPPKTVKKFRLSGDLHGVKIDQLFDERYAAARAFDEFGSPHELSIKEVDVAE